jgi:hypothetical protein
MSLPCEWSWAIWLSAAPAVAPQYWEPIDWYQKTYVQISWDYPFKAH